MGCEFLVMSLGEGFGVGFRGVVGGGSPVENEGKREGGGEGWGGPAKEPASQCARVCQNYPLANYRFLVREKGFFGKGVFRNVHFPELSGHYSRDWSESVNVIGVIREPFAREFR